jgi:hypothetical protein
MLQDCKREDAFIFWLLSIKKFTFISPQNMNSDLGLHMWKSSIRLSQWKNWLELPEGEL